MYCKGCGEKMEKGKLHSCGPIDDEPGYLIDKICIGRETYKALEKRMKKRVSKYQNKFKDGYTFWEMFWDEFNSLQ